MPKKGAYSSLNTAQKRKFHYVLREFSEGKLRSSSGEKITDRKQAIAVAFSEAKRHA